VNFVFIMTDSQPRFMVGAYGHKGVDTPNLDRLASEGIRFDRAYTACPLCTPARASIFSGLHPQLAGAWCNNIAPHNNVALMGTIFRHHGYRAAYTGKWHLDGTSYFGDGEPGGGFEGDWWYDGKRYAEDIGREMFDKYRKVRTIDDLREGGFTEENCWGTRVADRAIDFLDTVGDEPFVLAVSFDEPHGPFVAPPQYWERFDPDSIERRGNFFAPLDRKPPIQQLQVDPGEELTWEEHIHGGWARAFYGCNSFIDRQIGRVIDAVDRLHADDTMIIYTSDHGDQFRSHRLTGKGPMMYEETCCVPFIVRAPGLGAGRTTNALASHLDILPTMLDFAGVERPDVLNGVSLRPVMDDPAARVRTHAMLSFHRFAINHDSHGEFYPIRCITDGRYKLAINLFETDELYDLAEDPWELTNRIEDGALAAARDELHDRLLDRMDAIRDPFRSWRWGSRTWRKVRKPAYWGLPGRARPKGFAFQPDSL